MLPKITTPYFTTKLLSDGKKIEFRPFLVKEEKVLMMALQGEDPADISNAVFNILNDCVKTDINIEKLPNFDIEWLFLNLRAKSVGETINLKLMHQKQTDCDHVHETAITIENIALDKKPSDGVIQLTDEIGIKMIYPNVETIRKSSGQGVDMIMNIIENCIESVYDSDNVYSDFTSQEIRDFVESLSQEQFGKITEFLNGTPKLSYDVTWECPKCGESEDIHFEGLQSFFT